MTAADDEQARRAERSRAVALFRYSLIREAADRGLTTRQRGRLVRDLATREHAGPFGEPMRVSRPSPDRWIRAWRAGGFDALAPPARKPPRGPGRGAGGGRGAEGATAGGEPLAILLRADNAGSNTAAEHIEVARLAIAQLPHRARQRVLIRTDSGGGTHDFLNRLASSGRCLHYSVGITITEDIQDVILALPDRVWEPAYDAAGQVRPGAWVAELTGLLALSGWPAGMRVIVRRETRIPAPSCGSPILAGTGSPVSPPAPGAASSLTRSCATGGRHGARTASGGAKDTGLRNLSLHGFDQNQI